MMACLEVMLYVAEARLVGFQTCLALETNWLAFGTGLAGWTTGLVGLALLTP